MAEIKGGQKFERALRDIAAKVSNPATLKVGFLEGATYPDGTPVPLVAAIQNYGAPAAGIPPRPFFSNMVKDKRAGWPAAIAGLLKDNGYDAEKTLTTTGEVIRGQLQQAIRNFVGVPLKPATIARKGFDKQLVDSGKLLDSVGFEVKTG